MPGFNWRMLLPSRTRTAKPLSLVARESAKYNKPAGISEEMELSDEAKKGQQWKKETAVLTFIGKRCYINVHN